MNSTAQTSQHQPMGPRGERAAVRERPGWGGMLAEIAPLAEAIPFYGPPVGSLLVPWLFLVLILAGPFACLFAIALAMIVAALVLAALIAVMRAILAVPALLVGRVRRHRERHALIDAPAATVVAIQSPPVAA